MLRVPCLVLAAALLAVASPGVRASAEVAMFQWFDYVPSELLDRFTSETGIAIRTAPRLERGVARRARVGRDWNRVHVRFVA